MIRSKLHFPANAISLFVQLKFGQLFNLKLYPFNVGKCDEFKGPEI